VDSQVIRLDPSFTKGLRFSCTRCGACCRHVGQGVGLTTADAENLGGKIPKGPSETDHPVFVRTVPSFEGTCSFLSDADCEVYSQRPLVCRLYPFYISVKADGTLQVSIDHCPGVNLRDSELVDEEYITRQIIPSLENDRKFVKILENQILASKKSSYALVSSQQLTVYITWDAREFLWENLFQTIEGQLGATFYLRDVLECFKADLIPELEELILVRFAQYTVNKNELGDLLTKENRSLDSIMMKSKRMQAVHRTGIQKSAAIVQTETDSSERTTFRLRTEENFNVDSAKLLRMRKIEKQAIEVELEYLKEVVRREFVYNGVMVRPLTLRQEISLLFYLSDAIELTANALAIRDKKQAIDPRLINLAICEVDAKILTTLKRLEL
jgi:Fe-S-cluster containining protein